MQVRFELDDLGDEAAARQAVADGGAPEEADHLWGSIVLDHAGASVAVEDDLTILGMALCVRVPEALQRDGRAELRLVSWAGCFQFETQGDEVLLSGPSGESARLPRQALLDGLHGCGQRLAVFIADLAVGSPQYAFSGQALAEKLGRAG